MSVDPMGVIRASGGEEETLIISNIDFKPIHRVREKLSSVAYLNRNSYVNVN